MDIVNRREILQVYQDLPTGDLAGLVQKSRQNLQDLNPSRLDPLPFVVRDEEVPFLRSAVAQWGRLLTVVYRDLWGDQDLVTDGPLDHRLVWGDMGFDPAFSGALPGWADPLTLVRFDLVRRPESGWTLVGLGTDVARGLGTSLETRIAHARSFGSLVAHDNLVRLAPFFQGLKDQWFQSSPTHKDEPSIMVWTAGPSDPLYFEPVYLSRYFGYPLVESRDLTVRSGRVFLKTLGGLRPVDVLVRMVSDKTFDPLTGNPGGWGGVAGLTQAVRDGTVLVTNAPGTGILGHPALVARYPDVCRHLWGETLMLAPDASAAPGTEGFFEDGRWVQAPVGIRLFAARLAGNWDLLPGGLVQRVEGQSFDTTGFSGTKKDLWFLSDKAVAPVSLLPTGEKVSEINRGADLPSRVADDLFWLGRYTERAWVDLRFLEKWWQFHYEGTAEFRGAGAEFLDALVKTLGILPEAPEDGFGPEGEAWKASRLADTLGSITRISGQVLDRLSLETHRVLREFGQFLDRSGDQSVSEGLRQLNLRLAAFSGLTMESMTRSPGWRFLDMGRRLERAQMVLETLRTSFEIDGEDNLALLLDIFDSTLTYRTRYRLAPQRGPVLDLLVLDESNPRSLAFQIESLAQHVAHLPRESQRPHGTVEERTALDLLTRVRLVDGTALVPGVLEPFLDGLSGGLETLADALHRTYLAKIDPMEAIQARGRGEE
jgi:uncharacterized circularly permuted ATP-grasp superfamily protein/uncharacterized alpha-E superfamily protein